MKTAIHAVTRAAHLVILGALLTGWAYADEEVPLIDGTLWAASSEPEKVSYLIGMGNFMLVEYLTQTEHADPKPTRDQTMVQDFWDGFEDETLDGTIEAVDNWYAANPDDLAKPVIVVIWNIFVEPNLATQQE